MDFKAIISEIRNVPFWFKIAILLIYLGYKIPEVAKATFDSRWHQLAGPMIKERNARFDLMDEKITETNSNVKEIHRFLIEKGAK